MTLLADVMQQPADGNLEPIRDELIADIVGGRCVAFIGAGFSAAARLPQWTALVRDLADTPELKAAVKGHVGDLIARNPSAHDLDLAAQMLEDSLGRTRFVERLREILGVSWTSDTMVKRLRMLQDIPFRAILTTNFDPILEGEVPGPEAYHGILRKDPSRWWSDVFWNELPPLGEGSSARMRSPVIKLHGDVRHPEAEKHVVLTRRDYRRRLYTESRYTTFLRSLLATNTVLFMGVSFQDAYLNELRSEVLAMFEPEPSSPHRPRAAGERPLAYAIMPDVPQLVEEHFEKHEGIDILRYSTASPEGAAPDHSGFDRYLEGVWRATAIVPRFGQLLTGKRILWLDADEASLHAGFRFLERASEAAGAAHELVCVRDVEGAVRRLRERPFDRKSSPYPILSARDRVLE